MSTVSIIIPTYNRSKLLKECIDSLLAQTYSDFEILVIDDGSDDNTRDLVSEIQDKRLFYFYKENGGVCSARNFGMKRAKGNFVAFLDSDDYWPKDYLKVMTKNLKMNLAYGAVYSRIKLVDEYNNMKPFGRQDLFESGFITKPLFKDGIPVLESATLFRRSELRDFYWDEALLSSTGGDGFLRISKKVAFLFVPDVWAYRRAQENCICNNAAKSLSLNVPLVLERFYFNLGGSNILPKGLAYKEISHRYRRLAKRHFNNGNRKAAMKIFRRAIKYFPYDPRLYFDYLKAFFFYAKDEKNSDWEFPRPLSSEITVNQNNIRVE